MIKIKYLMQEGMIPKMRILYQEDITPHLNIDIVKLYQMKKIDFSNTTNIPHTVSAEKNEEMEKRKRMEINRKKAMHLLNYNNEVLYSDKYVININHKRQEYKIVVGRDDGINTKNIRRYKKI